MSAYLPRETWAFGGGPAYERATVALTSGVPGRLRDAAGRLVVRRTVEGGTVAIEATHVPQQLLAEIALDWSIFWPMPEEVAEALCRISRGLSFCCPPRVRTPLDLRSGRFPNSFFLRMGKGDQAAILAAAAIDYPNSVDPLRILRMLLVCCGQEAQAEIEQWLRVHLVTAAELQLLPEALQNKVREEEGIEAVYALRRSAQERGLSMLYASLTHRAEALEFFERASSDEEPVPDGLLIDTAARVLDELPISLADRGLYRFGIEMLAFITIDREAIRPLISSGPTFARDELLEALDQNGFASRSRFGAVRAWLDRCRLADHVSAGLEEDLAPAVFALDKDRRLWWEVAGSDPKHFIQVRSSEPHHVWRY